MELISFQELKDEFSLLNFMLFRYLQLQHALRTQFPSTPPQFPVSPILDTILGLDRKKLISVFYNDLLTPLGTKLAYQLKSRWLRNNGDVEDEDWDEILDACKQVSPKASDHLTQLYILHRAHLTPVRIARYSDVLPPPGDLFPHAVGLSSFIHDYWSHVVQFLHQEDGLTSDS